MTAAVDGVVLCRVGGARFAAPCDEVDAIADAEGELVDPSVAFGEVLAPVGRALQAAGQLLRVDSVDVVASPGLSVLPTPLALAGLVGGALLGFVELSGQLWPLVSVRGLLEWLSTEAAP
ncbi:MAG: hypothetical protein MUC96_02010 [Myxococcaceae bacterium]|nr:hypothetical protein [Myxococcaceae bacterium]